MTLASVSWMFLVSSAPAGMTLAALSQPGTVLAAGMAVAAVSRLGLIPATPAALAALGSSASGVVLAGGQPGAAAARSMSPDGVLALVGVSCLGCSDGGEESHKPSRAFQQLGDDLQHVNQSSHGVEMMRGCHNFGPAAAGLL